MTRHKIILNPAADRGAAANAVARIESTLRALGVSFDLVQTEHPRHAIALARQAVTAGYDAVIAAGGDGTANEVLNGLMQAALANEGTATMGVLCIGRGNDFAFGVDIPKDLDAGCKAIAEGHTRWIDVGHALQGEESEGRYFGNSVGIGFDAVVGFVAQRLKRLHGFAGYLVAALKTIFVYFVAPLVRVEYSGESLERRTLMVSIMNGRRLGGGFMMAPDGRPDDGQLDLCIADQVSRLRIFTLLLHFMKGTQASQPEISTHQTDRVTVTAVEGLLPAHADGETLCEAGSKLTVELLPHRLEIFVLAEAAE